MVALEKLMPWLRRIARLLPLLALIVFCDSCSGFFVSESSIQSIAVSPTSVILKAAANATTPGDSFTLSSSATTVAGNTSDDTATAKWTSSNPAVVTVVSNTGVLSVVGTAANSTAVITATDGGQSSTCNVLTYTGAAPTAIVIGFPSTVAPSTLSPNQSFQLTATATLNGNANTNISNYATWTSDAPAIATVSSSGIVTVLNTTGTFTVTATANLANNTTVTGTSTTFTVI